MVVKKEDGLYAISFSTPNASDERLHTMRLGLTKQDNGGVIGVSFGVKRKGVVLEYTYVSLIHLLLFVTSNLAKLYK